MQLRCAHCGHVEPLLTRRWRCVCGRPFVLEGVPEFRREAIQLHKRGLWRYRELLPPFEGEPVTLGEGGTPLLFGEWDGLRLGLKLEFMAPTGSFKDRGASVLVSFLRSWGVDDVLDDSSGNAGAALAAYGAHAGLHVRIFVPAHASAAKRAQIAIYGAELVTVEGPRPRATEAALKAVDEGAYYASALFRVSNDKKRCYVRFGKSSGTFCFHFGIEAGKFVVGTSAYDYYGTVTPGTTYFLVAKLVTHTGAPEEAFLNVYAPGETVPTEEPTSWDYYYTSDWGRDYPMGRISVRTRFEGTGEVDEIRTSSSATTGLQRLSVAHLLSAAELRQSHHRGSTTETRRARRNGRPLEKPCVLHVSVVFFPPWGSPLRAACAHMIDAERGSRVPRTRDMITRPRGQDNLERGHLLDARPTIGLRFPGGPVI